MTLKFISGLADCHLPGLYSLVLNERKSADCGMRRVFYTTRRMPLWDRDCGDFILKPHNHRQTISLTRLAGEVINWRFKLASDPDTGMDLHVFAFQSALLSGEFSTKHAGTAVMNYTPERLTFAPLRLHWSEVHTVTAQQGAVWLVDEFELAPTGREQCLSTQADLVLDPKLLYRPLDDAELRRVESVINEKLQETAA